MQNNSPYRGGKITYQTKGSTYYIVRFMLSILGGGMKISLDFLSFMSARDVLTSEFDVSKKETRILRAIITAYVNKDIITVNDILALKDVGSQATNHTTLKTLIKKNLVISVNDPLDLRIKHLKPTHDTLDLFVRLSAEFTRYANKKTKPVNVSIARGR